MTEPSRGCKQLHRTDAARIVTKFRPSAQAGLPLRTDEPGFSRTISAKQARIVRLLVERLEVSPSEVNVGLRLEALASRVGDRGPPTAMRS